MTFRIKNTYQFNGKRNYDGDYITEIPELVFSRSDDNSLINNIEQNRNSVFIKAERLCFNKIFNIENQNIKLFSYNEQTQIWSEVKSILLKRGQYNYEDLDLVFKKILQNNIIFNFKADNTKISGILEIENKNKYDIKLVLKKKMALILGILTENNLENICNNYIDVIIIGNYTDETGQIHNKIKSIFNILRPLKDIKLYSKFLFNYSTELCQTNFSKNDINIKSEKNLDYDFELNNISLNSKLFKCDRFNHNYCKFFFLDFFNEYVYFDFVELILFISNKA